MDMDTFDAVEFEDLMKNYDKIADKLEKNCNGVEDVVELIWRAFLTGAAYEYNKAKNEALTKC